MKKTQELVLLYNFQNTEKARKLKAVLIQMGIRIKNVEKEAYLEPIGSLCGIEGIEKTDKQYEGEGFPEEMLVMKGMSGGRVDTLLTLLRKNKVEKIQLKAILTETNQQWNSLELYEELKKEHEAMSKQ